MEIKKRQIYRFTDRVTCHFGTFGAPSYPACASRVDRMIAVAVLLDFLLACTRFQLCRWAGAVKLRVVRRKDSRQQNPTRIICLESISIPYTAGNNNGKSSTSLVIHCSTKIVREEEHLRGLTKPCCRYVKPNFQLCNMHSREKRQLPHTLRALHQLLQPDNSRTMSLNLFPLIAWCAILLLRLLNPNLPRAPIWCLEVVWLAFGAGGGQELLSSPRSPTSPLLRYPLESGDKLLGPGTSSWDRLVAILVPTVAFWSEVPLNHGLSHPNTWISAVGMAVLVGMHQYGRR